jgi:hypothetical protein
MRATRLSVANYNTTLSSDSLETGTGSSNSLRSAKQSLLEILGSGGRNSPRLRLHSVVWRHRRKAQETVEQEQVSAEASGANRLLLDEGRLRGSLLRLLSWSPDASEPQRINVLGLTAPPNWHSLVSLETGYHVTCGL